MRVVVFVHSLEHEGSMDCRIDQEFAPLADIDSSEREWTHSLAAYLPGRISLILCSPPALGGVALQLQRTRLHAAHDLRTLGFLNNS
jgi:hypothetical protein